MKPIHRIPSSIRVRRTESEQNRSTYHSSADTYAGRNNVVDAQPQAAGTDDPYGQTPTQGTSSHNDYFTIPGWRRGSTSTAGGDAGTDRRDRTTPSAEVDWHSPKAADNEAYNDQEDDDDMLREEMQAARRAIHDQEKHEPRQRRYKNIRNPPGDYPPIRLSDNSLQPSVPLRTTSRRPGAVEGLAMRHHRLHKEERRQKRREQRDSVSSATSSHSTGSDAAQQSASDDSATRRDNQAATMQPQHHRNLSDVREEGRSASALQTPQIAQAGPADGSSPSSQRDGNMEQRPSRPRRNTVSAADLMASSRRLYDTLLRRRSERDFSENDQEQQSALMRSSRGQENRSDEDLYTPTSSGSSDLHEDEVVDYLDVVDPEVATVTALQNVGNSIFFPPIPFLYNRRPTISLPSAANRRAPPTPTGTPQGEARPDDIEMGMRPGSRQGPDDQSKDSRPGFGSIRRVASLVPGRKKKQVPPTTEEERRKHIKEWADMDEEERNELDEHVHLLLTKKAKFKRAARGFWRYVKTPHGFIITTYAFLITFWGTAICLFLLRWINVGNPARQRYWIEICDQILCALFAAVGLGFAPFRAVDTYRMVQIAHYHFLTYKRRKELNLPELKDKNELPRAAPRLNMSQMTNTMMIKTGLRKSPGLAADGENEADTEGAVTSGDTDNVGSGHAGHAGPQTADSSWEVLDPVQSRQSACEVEELKEKRKRKHGFFHRKKHSKEDVETGGKDQTDQQRTDAEQLPSQGSPAPPPKKTAHKTYPNKDGIIPLGQLKRNPSIASELPRDAEDVVVLSPKQQANLEYQQRKFHESHTFYRYRETVTHRPFELSLMMAIVILLDCHSCLQASLGGTTWGIYYKNRPTSVTATIITFSLSCNAVAGILIWLGGNRTKKKEEVERLLRIALEEEALRKMKKKQRRRLELERLANRDWEEEGKRLHGDAGVAAVGGDVQGRDFQSNDEAERHNADRTHTEMQGQAQNKKEPPSQTPALECIQEH